MADTPTTGTRRPSAEGPNDLTRADAGVPASLQGAAGAARGFAERSKAENTKRAYRADWRCFRSWCAERRLDALPADVRTVTLVYSGQGGALRRGPRAQGVDARRRPAAISQAHRMAGLPSPASTREEPLHSVWAGLVRSKGRARDKVDPALTPDVVATAEALPTVDLGDGAWEWATAAKRDRADPLVGFAGALRRSELAALEARELSFGSDGLRVRLRTSKTDQEGAGAVLGLHYGDRPRPYPSGLGPFGFNNG